MVWNELTGLVLPEPNASREIINRFFAVNRRARWIEQHCLVFGACLIVILRISAISSGADIGLILHPESLFKPGHLGSWKLEETGDVLLNLFP